MRNWVAGILLSSILCNPVFAQHDHVQIAQQNMPAVVVVNVLKKDGGTFSGTGFILTQDGLMATSRHVLEDALYVNVTFNNAVVSGEAIPLAEQENTDLALLKISAQHLPYITLGNSDTVRPGQTITVIGNPRRLQNTVTSGIISQVRQKEDLIWHQISAPISPSSSGSPIFDENGKVISIAFASMAGENNQNLNFAIPVNYLRELLTANGFSVEDPTPEEPTNPLWRHLQKSWQISKRLFTRWFSKPQTVNP
ncbi:MAG: trypsin-like peptidase domain-containing protein [Elusimicrobiaceae bacterium]|nr:trypsin-like peptidase domain-containing protein [Elusimicrobiaceae bacterium]